MPCATDADTQLDAAETPGAGESPQHANMFTRLCATRKGQGQSSGALTLEYSDLVAPAHMGVQVKDPHLRAGMQKSAAILNLRVPMFINMEELNQGDVLWWRA